MKIEITEMDKKGRIAIPSRILKKVNINERDKITVQLDRDCLVIKKYKD